MARPAELDPDLPLSSIMQRWPETIAIFLKHRMLCVGCPIGPYHTIGDACREYGMEQSQLMEELAVAISRKADLPVPQAGEDE